MIYMGIDFREAASPYLLGNGHTEEEEGVRSDTMFDRVFSRSSAKPLSPLDDFLRRYGKDTDRELLDGATVERMPVSLEHEKLRVWLEWLLKEYLKAMPGGVLLDSSTVIVVNERRLRRPDLAYLSAECRDMLKGGAVHGAPDLIIEIVSSGFRSERERERLPYARRTGDRDPGPYQASGAPPATAWPGI
jgi:hypothetical protein